MAKDYSYFQVDILIEKACILIFTLPCVECSNGYIYNDRKTTQTTTPPMSTMGGTTIKMASRKECFCYLSYCYNKYSLREKGFIPAPS